MKAIVATKYGSPDVLELREVENPTPRDNEVLIEVHAATVTAGDCEIRRFDIPILFWLFLRFYLGILKPRNGIFGQELAGQIKAVGKKVTQFKPGDQVFLPTDMSLGAYAEYKCIKDSHIISQKPATISYGEAATIPTGGLNALHFIRKINLRQGDKLLINGAGGSIGTYALQLAKHAGAIVTCVDHGKKLDMLQGLGADHVIDYTKADYTRNGKTYDAIIDIVGTSPYTRTIKSLNPAGRFMLGNPSLSSMIRGVWTTLTSQKKVISQLAGYKTEYLDQLKDLITEGQLKVIIDKTYPLEEVAEAHRYVDSGFKKGNVIINIKEED